MLRSKCYNNATASRQCRKRKQFLRAIIHDYICGSFALNVQGIGRKIRKWLLAQVGVAAARRPARDHLRRPKKMFVKSFFFLFIPVDIQSDFSHSDNLLHRTLEAVLNAPAAVPRTPLPAVIRQGIPANVVDGVDVEVDEGDHEPGHVPRSGLHLEYPLLREMCESTCFFAEKVKKISKAAAASFLIPPSVISSFLFSSECASSVPFPPPPLHR